jgi:Zn-dependent protease
MRGPYSDYAAPPIYLTREPSKRGARFSPVELKQLLIAILALTAAMTILFRGMYVGAQSGSEFALAVGLGFLTSLVAVSTGVGLHEIAHKVVAQRYGHWAEFRYNPMGLVLAFVFAIVGFLYGAPGATLISGPVTGEQNGKISAAGPVTNLGLAVLFLGILAVLNATTPRTSLAAFAIWLVVNFAAFINLVLAGFNMIPVLPLDGAKVWAWNKVAFVAILGTVAGLFALGFLSGLLQI